MNFEKRKTREIQKRKRLHHNSQQTMPEHEPTPQIMIPTHAQHGKYYFECYCKKDNWSLVE